MSCCVRARSEKQKEQCLVEIKEAADALFSAIDYQEITLTTIANKLGWSRCKLYNYVTTKEDIFLEIIADKRDAYMTNLLSAYPLGCTYSHEVLAEVWANILNCHRDYLKYCAILSTIIETNVSIERLAAFKKSYYTLADQLNSVLAENLHISNEKAEQLFLAIYHYAVGTNSGCQNHPLIKEAMSLIGKERTDIPFCETMKDFILMCLNWYTK